MRRYLGDTTTAAPQLVGGAAVDEIYTALAPQVRRQPIAWPASVSTVPTRVWIAAAVALLIFLNQQHKRRR